MNQFINHKHSLLPHPLSWPPPTSPSLRHCITSTYPTKIWKLSPPPFQFIIHNSQIIGHILFIGYKWTNRPQTPTTIVPIHMTTVVIIATATIITSTCTTKIWKLPQPKPKLTPHRHQPPAPLPPVPSPMQPITTPQPLHHQKITNLATTFPTIQSSQSVSTNHYHHLLFLYHTTTINTTQIDEEETRTKC